MKLVEDERKMIVFTGNLELLLSWMDYEIIRGDFNYWYVLISEIDPMRPNTNSYNPFQINYPGKEASRQNQLNRQKIKIENCSNMTYSCVK